MTDDIQRVTINVPRGYGMAEHNPWLVLIGRDAFGTEIVETIPAPPPPFYFWLGKDAYPQIPTISAIEVVQAHRTR